MKNYPMNTKDGQPIKFQLSLSCYGRENYQLTKSVLGHYWELQKKEEESVEEWLSEECTIIQELKELKDGNNYQVKAKNIGGLKDKVWDQEKEELSHQTFTSEKLFQENQAKQTLTLMERFSAF